MTLEFFALVLAGLCQGAGWGCLLMKLLFWANNRKRWVVVWN